MSNMNTAMTLQVASVPAHTDKVQEDIDALLHNLQVGWAAPLMMPMHTGNLNHDDGSTAQMIDIVNFISSPIEDGLSDIAYFDRQKYPPPVSSGEALRKGLHKLFSDMQNQALDSGFSLVRQGSLSRCRLAKSKPGPAGATLLGQYVIACQRCRKYWDQSTKRNQTQQSQPHVDFSHLFRSTSLHRDDKNSRGKDGNILPRRTNTNRPISNDLTCKFRIVIKSNSFGWFIEKRGKSLIHTHHIRRIRKDVPDSVRHMTSEQREDMQKLSNALTAPSAGRTFALANHKKVMTRSQIRWAFHKQDESGVLHYNGIPINQVSVVEWLRSAEDICYCIWGANRPNAEQSQQLGLVFNEGYDEQGVPTITNLTEFCRDSLDRYRRECEAAELRENQSFYIACAFCTTEARRLFRLFPEVFKIDTTCGSNRECRPLATVSIRTGSGSYMVVAYFFLQDEKRITFRWIFQIALPALFGREVLSRVRCIISDGDAQETTELDDAISCLMPGAYRLQCAWHIVDQGWKRVVPFGRVHSTNSVKVKREEFRSLMHNWLYSFARPGYYEDEQEANIAKSILLAYVNSSQVLQFLNQEIVDHVNRFITNHVFVHERVLFFWRKKCIRCYDEATNSSHEGTNLGMKQHHVALRPGASVTMNSAILQMQSTIKTSEEHRKSSLHLEAMPTWTSSPTSGKVSPFCNQLISGEWNRAKEGVYEVKRTPEVHVWSVVAKIREITSKIPRFIHERIIRVDGSARMTCTCEHFSRCGYPCCHIAAVVQYEDPCIDGFSHHDIDVHWWTVYQHYALRGAGNMVENYLLELCTNPISGPKFPTSIQSKAWVPLDSYTPLQVEAKYRCLNYSDFNIDRAASIFSAENAGLLTQESQCNVDSTEDPFPSQLSQNDYDHPEECEECDDFPNNDVFEYIDENATSGHDVAESSDMVFRGLAEEWREFVSLGRARNCPRLWEHEAIELKRKLTDINVAIRREMRATSSTQQEGEWVSYNPQQSAHSRRFHASRNCL